MLVLPGIKKAAFATALPFRYTSILVRMDAYSAPGPIRTVALPACETASGAHSNYDAGSTTATLAKGSTWM